MERGAWTKLVGPLTPGASAVVLGSACVSGAAVAATTARRVGPGRGIVTGLVAIDLVGGLVTFQLRPTREQYAQSSTRSRMTFVLAHVQPFALPLTGQGTWRRAALRYATAVLATGALETLRVPVTRRRAVANAIAAAAGITDVATAPPGQRWFGPVYLMKLIGGHGGVPHSSRASAWESSHRS